MDLHWLGAVATPYGPSAAAGTTPATAMPAPAGGVTSIRIE